MPKRKKKPSAQVVYQIKVVLVGSDPLIWRRILVPGDATLEDLHYILQEAMGWENDHLHQFFVRGKEYAPPELAQFPLGRTVANEARAKLSDLAPRKRSVIRYVYDMGDLWEHELVVEKVQEPEAGASYPACVAGERACPPEDCGGLWGYYDMLEAVQDSKHPEHEDLKEWLGGDFDRDAFDLDEVNERLRPERSGRGWARSV